MEKVSSFSQKIEGIVPIGLKSSSSINALPSISVEDSPFSIFLSERLLEAFSDSIDVVAVDLGSDFEIVVTEDDVLFVG